MGKRYFRENKEHINNGFCFYEGEGTACMVPLLCQPVFHGSVHITTFDHSHKNTKSGHYRPTEVLLVDR